MKYWILALALIPATTFANDAFKMPDNFIHFQCFDTSRNQLYFGLTPKVSKDAVCDATHRRLIEVKDGKCVFAKGRSYSCKDVRVFLDDPDEICSGCYNKNEKMP